MREGNKFSTVGLGEPVDDEGSDGVGLLEERVDETPAVCLSLLLKNIFLRVHLFSVHS